MLLTVPSTGRMYSVQIFYREKKFRQKERERGENIFPFGVVKEDYIGFH